MFWQVVKQSWTWVWKATFPNVSVFGVYRFKKTFSSKSWIHVWVNATLSIFIIEVQYQSFNNTPSVYDLLYVSGCWDIIWFGYLAGKDCEKICSFWFLGWGLLLLLIKETISVRKLSSILRKSSGSCLSLWISLVGLRLVPLTWVKEQVSLKHSPFLIDEEHILGWKFGQLTPWLQSFGTLFPNFKSFEHAFGW